MARHLLMEGAARILVLRRKAARRAMLLLVFPLPKGADATARPTIPARGSAAIRRRRRSALDHRGLAVEAVDITKARFSPAATSAFYLCVRWLLEAWLRD